MSGSGPVVVDADELTIAPPPAPPLPVDVDVESEALSSPHAARTAATPHGTIHH